jgi:hypothetical protein
MKTAGLSKIKCLSLIMLGMLQTKTIYSQDEATWWNQTHQWDGVTPWQEYIIYSPSYMGPNALPVPFSQKGLVLGRYELQLGFTGHFGSGDNTQDAFLRLYYPVVKNMVAVELYGVPIEHYEMDKNTIIERRTRHRDGNGFATGDFYFTTIIQISKNRKLPEIALRMACKTASGGMLSDARFTDAPGYFFDLSAGKDLRLQCNRTEKIRFHGMLGFYSWQMNLPNNQQNDAILYGGGVDIIFKAFRFEMEVDGYSGYFGKKEVVVANKYKPVKFSDRPAVGRVQIVKPTCLIDLSLGFQSGINDFEYLSICFSLISHLN